MAEKPTGPSGANFLVGGAALVIVIAGVKVTSSVLLPIFVALFLTLICWPIVRRLARFHVPEPLAIVLVVLLLVVVLFVLTGVLANSVSAFSASVKDYSAGLDKMARDVMAKLEKWHLVKDAHEEEFAKVFDTGKILSLVSGTMQGLLSMLSSVVVILLFVAFMLFEASGFPGKLRRALGNPDADLAEFTKVGQQVWDYMEVKTVVSLITGVLVAVFVAIVGVDFPILWGIVAFLFNYIPNIGSVLAAIPACALALLQHGFGTAAVLACGYVGVNMVVGNVIEPRMMGRKLGLSTVVVLFSLIFWNWVLGPVGMLLSVPLTMVVKIFMENTSDFRSVAILIGPTEPGDLAPLERVPLPAESTE